MSLSQPAPANGREELVDRTECALPARALRRCGRVRSARSLLRQDSGARTRHSLAFGNPAFEIILERANNQRATRPEPAAAQGSAGEVFRVFLKLGMTSFGGPVAHLGYFRAEFVDRRRWLSERAYVDLVALSQFLPGPASSQTGLGS